MLCYRAKMLKAARFRRLTGVQKGTSATSRAAAEQVLHASDALGRQTAEMTSEVNQFLADIKAV